MLKIAIVGPESTGKSAMSAALAEEFNTTWAPEFARSYLVHTQGKYVYETLETILVGQLVNEDMAIAKANGIAFIDTNPLVLKIWSMVVFGRVSSRILHACETLKYDFTLLMNIDLPWEDDPLREHPDKREYLFELYVNELEKLRTPFQIISGLGAHRMENALQALKDFKKLPSLLG